MQYMVITPHLVLLITLLAIWTIPWKAVALWKSARRNNLAWFIILLLVNTIGILEIIYIFAVARNKQEKPTEND